MANHLLLVLSPVRLYNVTDTDMINSFQMLYHLLQNPHNNLSYNTVMQYHKYSLFFLFALHLNLVNFRYNFWYQMILVKHQVNFLHIQKFRYILLTVVLFHGKKSLLLVVHQINHLYPLLSIPSLPTVLLCFPSHQIELPTVAQLLWTNLKPLRYNFEKVPD